MAQQVEERLKVSPFLVFFLVNSIQIGVGVLSFQSSIVKHAGYDSWLSIIIAGIATNVILWMIYKMLLRENDDVFAIQSTLFGKWIGGMLGVLLIFHYLLMSILALRVYIEIVQVWMFPRISVLVLGLVFLILIYYIINGGFRVVAGICFLGVVIPLYLIISLLFPLEFANFHNLLPILNHSVKDYLLSTKEMVLSFLGFSLIMVYYPFINNPEKSKKWAYLAIFFTMITYIAVALVTFVFYDEKQIETILWPTLGLWKIIEMPFVERFEFIGISSWALVILPNITLSLWASSRGIKRIFGFNQRKTLIFFLIITLIGVSLIKGHDMISQASKYFSTFGLYIVYGYIPLLFIIHTIYYKVRKRK